MATPNRGELKEDTLKTIESAGRKGKNICLHPAKQGFRGKGIKLPVTVKGRHGYCGEKINDLLVRMA